MRIGIDIRELEKNKFTGIGRYLRQFLAFAAENDPDNTYIFFGNQKTEFTPSRGNQKLCIQKEKMTVFWDQIYLPMKIRQEKVEVFLSPYFKTPVCCPCKKITIINDLIPLMVPAYSEEEHNLKTLYWKWGTQLAAKFSKKIITISHQTKNDLIRIFHADESKINVVHLAVDGRYNSFPIDKSVLEKYGITNPFIFSTSNFKPHKNIAGLIEAYHRLHSDIRNKYQLVLGGKCPEPKSFLRQHIEELNLTDNIIFTNMIDEEDLPHFYNAAEMFVFPSFYEGFGLPVLEAMACGTPVIVSNTGSLPELTENAGLLINPHNINEITDAILKILNDTSLRELLIQRGLQRASNFTVEKMGRKILETLIHC